MKTLRVFTLLLLPFMAMAQNAPFPPASTSDVVAGTERNKFVSPYTLSQAGFSSPTGGITAAVATNIAAYQAQLATNGLTGSGTSGAVTNNDTRAIDLKYASVGDKFNSVTFDNYLGGATNATLYRKSQYIYTNASSAMVFYDLGLIGQGPPTITNSAHNNLDSDYAAINLGVNLPGESISSGWEDALGALPTMSGTYTSSSNNVFGNQVSANTFNPYGIANFGSNVSSTVDNNGLAPDSSSVKVNINQNSDNYKVGIAVINKYPNLTEWYLENQTNGTRMTDLVLGVNAFAQAFIGSSALFRIIDPVSPYPHLNLLTANRTNGVIAVSNLLVNSTFSVTNNTAGTNIAVISSSGSVINGVGLTNGSLTVPNNLSVAGTFNVNSTTATNFTIINPWDGRLITNNLIGVWTFGYQVAQTSAGVGMIPNAYGANFTQASGTTNIGVTLFRVPFNCYLSNLNIGYYNASGTAHVGSNYVVSVSTNSFLDTTTSTLITNVANGSMSFATNTGFSTALTKNQHVGFMIVNTNAAHSPASQTLIGSIGVYSR